MTITMYQADRNFVTPVNDASLYSALARDTSAVINRGDRFKTSVNGLTITVGTGQAIIQGRLVEIIDPEVLVLPANSSGTIALVVDLSQDNDVSGTVGDVDYAVTVNQVYLSAVSGTITQDDLNNGGVIYELPLANFTSTATTASLTTTSSLLHQPIIGRPTLLANYKQYPGGEPLLLYKSGNVVTLSGAITNKYDVSTSVGSDPMFTLPAGFIPPYSYRTVQQGTGMNRFMLTVNTDGQAYNARYGAGSNVKIPKGSWLNVFATYTVIN
ncbi:hypothetical protein [Weissella soli]|uniref:Uncharacterized protein n=1 Tax=Weissella soli TaxID=155866 RepID=A0A288Q8R6_9LACO|nr:hypothetical protein [Weissella soli]AOT56554.1 hypothetical protein WSWS_00923 [Weissella soli]NKY83007.1 hypothetical protein [Weissella soli]RDL12122.1 hypothetical protein DFP99_0553 [Weissella soli]GEN92645.1 hypothetical protein WSO01_02570 [Weissella soli]